MLAGLSGHGNVPEPKASTTKTKKNVATKKKVQSTNKRTQEKPKADAAQINNGGNLGLTVRVEINLPADGSKETYDAIFKSIKENLLGE
ncbi:MAG: hypothetical protein JAZ21_07135 [Candidatus Thiodiazotropha taylori]|nr:hypothetical protein [Candidatus Thiodiazotropha taylori]